MNGKTLFNLVPFLMLGSTGMGNAQYNVLNQSEKDSNYTLLFDGKNIDGDIWKQWYPKKAPLERNRYVVDNTEEAMHKIGGATNGNIMTDSIYRDFIFKFEFKSIHKTGEDNANSGIIYRAFDGQEWAAAAGIEYQIMDISSSVNNATASAYGIYAPDPYPWKSKQWNTGEIHANGDVVSHYLNGVEVVKYDRKSPDFLSRLGNSRFGSFTGTDPVDGRSVDFSNAPQGWIVIQDYGDAYDWWFRDLKITRLPIPVTDVHLIEKQASIIEVEKNLSHINIKVNHESDYKLTVHSLEGKLMYQSINVKRRSHRIKNLNQGVYVVDFKSRTGKKRMSKRIVVN